MFETGSSRETVLRLLEQEGGASEEAVRRVAERTGTPEAEVWGAASFFGLLRDPRPRHRVCDGLSCQIAGGDKLARSLEGAGREVERVSCLGQCDRAPAALDADIELLDPRPTSVLPDDDDLPINLGGKEDRGYGALARAREMGAERVLHEIEQSGLQGRGGAALPAHLKWRSVREQEEAERFVVCNADEGEPGTFKDREVLLRRPHKLLEGLAVTAGVVGAREVYVYVRGELREGRRRLEAALREAREALGGCDWHVVGGHGAYVCGEKTALIESMSGLRGMPRMKPPFPTERGFRGKPTLVHNVETAACVPAIVSRGGRWFRDLGRSEPGAKLYSVSGNVGRSGVYELPLGVGCQIDLHVVGGKVVKVSSPPPGETVNDGNLCVKGRFAYDFIHHPERLTEPLVRGEDGGLHPTTWEHALERAALGLTGIKETHGADSLGFISSSRCTGEENYLVQKLARAAVGTNNVHQCAAT